jgi:hypothetical protein
LAQIASSTFQLTSETGLSLPWITATWLPLGFGKNRFVSSQLSRLGEEKVWNGEKHCTFWKGVLLGRSGIRFGERRI